MGSPEFAAAVEAIRRSTAQIIPITSLLKRESILLRRCIRCPERIAQGECPGKRNCREAKRLGLDDECLNDSIMPRAPRTSSIMGTPLAAARGGSNGASQTGTTQEP